LPEEGFGIKELGRALLLRRAVFLQRLICEREDLVHADALAVLEPDGRDVHLL
jgi:hypothetical protein